MVDPAKVHPVNRRLDIPCRVYNRSIGAPKLDPRRAFDDIGVPEYSSDGERPGAAQIFEGGSIWCSRPSCMTPTRSPRANASS